MTKKTGVLLVNLGTPNSPSVGDVRTYLTEFLNDPRVIDINPIGRWMLVNLIIVPFRSPKSAKIYKKLWTKKGSPLLFHTESLTEKVRKKIPENYVIEFAMRYQNPSIQSKLDKLREQNVSKIIIIPLFPQYASASTGSVVEKIMKIVSKWHTIPNIQFVNQFYDDEDFIDCFVNNIKKENYQDYDYVLFSYHGLPERQLDNVYEKGLCKDKHCEEKITKENQYCYKATCYETTRLIADKLNLSKDKYSVSFQSRLDDGWVKPYSDVVLKELAQKGIKKVLVTAPAFVADCLETTIEIGEEYQELFIENGGEKLHMVSSLNDNDDWVNYLSNKITSLI